LQRAEVLNSGAKQQGHLISRSDFVPEARKSITAVTSTWSSGEAGPLGLCVPDGFVKQEVMDQWNAKHEGRAFMFQSQSTSHFMCSETWLVLLHGLIAPALALQRKKLGVASSTPALLLADGWTGFHSHKTGLDAAREAWSRQSHCYLPAVQARSGHTCCVMMYVDGMPYAVLAS